MSFISEPLKLAGLLDLMHNFLGADESNNAPWRNLSASACQYISNVSIDPLMPQSRMSFGFYKQHISVHSCLLRLAKLLIFAGGCGRHEDSAPYADQS